MSQTVIVERDVMVPMRDGVKLATDVYRPADEARHPVLVHRTPYNKGDAWIVGGLMFSPLEAVQRGYVVVIQDSRGRFKSEGDWRPFVVEGPDGYDTVEWAAAQPWSDGNVGIYGSSYNGVTTLQAALASPPHLKACAAYMTGANYHQGWTYSSGAFELGFNLWWAINLAWDTILHLGLDQEALMAAMGKLAVAASDPWQPARHLPLPEIPALQDGIAPYWQEWLSHPTYDSFWKQVDVAAHADRIKAPLLHITGWYDGFLRGHLDLNERLKAHPDRAVRDSHRLIIGPWDHISYLSIRPTASGEREFGPLAATGPAGLGETYFQWFDHWLKGEETPLFSTQRVRYFLLGENAWREADSWPAPHTPTRYYLHSDGRANTRFGDGALTSDPPTNEPPDSYIYDPSNPVPTVGGRALAPVFSPSGVLNQAQVEEREDVLVYTSAHLTAPLTIAGPVTATLFVASSAPDTDFTAKLVDVQPDGYCAPIAEGIIRARYRNSMEREELLPAGQVVELTVDLLAVAHTFLPGHRIRLEISSSNFPKYDRNLNSEESPTRATATHMRPAVQQVFHDSQHPSHLTLPVAS